MTREELPIFVFGLLGALYVAWEARSRFAVVASAWAIGLFLAYSILGYKTPWLMLNWVLPFALVGGYALGRAWQARRTVIHAGAPIVLSVGLAFSGVQAGLLAFRDYDNDTNAYVYVPTKRDVLTLVDWIHTEDARLGAGGQIGVVVMSPDYWPLPWYLRDDKKAGFYGSIVDVAAPIQIVKTDQVASLPATFNATYERVGQYTLRGGVDLVVYLARGRG
jgi:predicted membrane-bound mannosyltransferase